MFDKHQGYVTSTDLSRDGEKIVSADSKGFIVGVNSHGPSSKYEVNFRPWQTKTDES